MRNEKWFRISYIKKIGSGIREMQTGSRSAAPDFGSVGRGLILRGAALMILILISLILTILQHIYKDSL